MITDMAMGGVRMPKRQWYQMSVREIAEGLSTDERKGL
jgi:hypothetical protein